MTGEPSVNRESHVLTANVFRVDSNKSGSITPQELQSALVNGSNTEFNMTTINMMISE